jgi:hypothetical protein
MKFLAVLFFGASVAYAQRECTSFSFGCQNDNVGDEEAIQTTQEICKSLRGNDCFCPQWGQTFCGIRPSNIDRFTQQCEERGNGWYLAECE